MAHTATATLNVRRPAADVCRDHGWGVGTRLVGDEGFGPTTIEITAIGEKLILAKRVHQPRTPPSSYHRGESVWTLECRDWQPV